MRLLSLLNAAGRAVDMAVGVMLACSALGAVSLQQAFGIGFALGIVGGAVDMARARYEDDA